jgi:propanol-preferring alcohol dehydrogenase
MFQRIGQPLVARGSAPQPAANQLRSHSGAVCRTDLHIVDGELPQPKLPPFSDMNCGTSSDWRNCHGFPRSRGIPGSVGRAEMQVLRSGRENLCDNALHRLHNRWRYAEFYRRCALLFSTSRQYDDVSVAPLLTLACSVTDCPETKGRAQTWYLWFRAAAFDCPVALFESVVFAFTKPGDKPDEVARSLGMAWAGSSDEMPPEIAPIIFAPVDR